MGNLIDSNVRANDQSEDSDYRERFIGIAAGAAQNLFQKSLVRRLTFKLFKNGTAQSCLPHRT